MLLIVTHSLATLEVSFVSRNFYNAGHCTPSPKSLYVLSISLSFETTKVVSIDWIITQIFRHPKDNFGPTVIITVIIMPLFKPHLLAENIFQAKNALAYFPFQDLVLIDELAHFDRERIPGANIIKLFASVIFECS
jgi:hypothetical protein